MLAFDKFESNQFHLAFQYLEAEPNYIGRTSMGVFGILSAQLENSISDFYFAHGHNEFHNEFMLRS